MSHPFFGPRIAQDTPVYGLSRVMRRPSAAASPPVEPAALAIGCLMIIIRPGRRTRWSAGMAWPLSPAQRRAGPPAAGAEGTTAALDRQIYRLRLELTAVWIAR